MQILRAALREADALLQVVLGEGQGRDERRCEVNEYPEGNGNVWMQIELAVMLGGLALCVYALANWDALVAKIVEVL